MSLVDASGQIIAARPFWARTVFAQLRGLIHRSIDADEALLLPHCPQVHTAFLAYPIDVAFCAGNDQAGYRLLYTQTLTPWQVSRFVSGASLVIEMRAGSPLLSLEAGTIFTLR